MIDDPVQLLEELNPERSAGAPPLEVLWRRLDAEGRMDAGEAGDGAGRPTSAGRRPRGRAIAQTPTWALAAVSVAVVAVVFVGAFVIGGGRGHVAASRPGAVASRSELVKLLGVLRGPQTPAARAFDQRGWPTPPRGPGSRIEPDRSLIRLATVTPWGAKVFIVPLTAPANPTLEHQLGETVALWVQGIGWSDYSRVADIETGAAWGPGATYRHRTESESRFFEIVPDGVVKVVFYLLRRMPAPGQSPQFSGSVSAEVHGNVAAFQAKGAAGSAAPVYAAWYSASGRLVKRVGDWNTFAKGGGRFPMAPRTQPGRWSGSAGPCPLARPNPYLPPRSGCVSSAIADVNGDGRPDLILLYGRLGSGRLAGGFLPTSATLKVVLASGSVLSTQIPRTGSSVNPAIMLVRNVNDRPGAEVFVLDGHLSSGESVGVYTFDGHRLRHVGEFMWGGDSNQRYGLTCRSGRPASIVQHQFLLQTGGAKALWQETDTVFTWIGSDLRRTSQHSSYRRSSREIGGLGIPPKSLTSVRC